MEDNIEVSRELELAELKKQSLERTCEVAHSQSSSIMLFTLQWKELEEHLNKTMRSVEEKGIEVDSKLKLLEERERVVELKESELVQFKLGLRSREGELDVLRTSVSDWTEKLSLKNEELCSIEFLTEKLELKHEVRKEKFDLEDQSIKTLIQDFNEELEAKEHEYNEIKKSVEACNGALEAKECEYDEIKKSIQAFNEELETKREKLKLTDEHLAELHSQVGKLESLENNTRRRIDSTEKKLSAMKGELRRYGNDIELREREFNALCKYTDECNEELTLKQQQLNSVQDLIEKCTKELKEKEELIMSIEKALVKCSEELEQKEKQLGSVQNSVAVLSDEHLSEELELDLLRSMTSQVYEELKEKEQHFNSLENSVKERVQDLVIKEEQFEERVKERVHVKIEQEQILVASEGVGNGRILQMLMNEHLKKADLFLSEISSSLEAAQDPAKLVLEAMQGFYPKGLQEKEMSSSVIVTRRTCILLLQHLLIVSPLINPQVRDAAMKLAGEWKENMRVVADNPLEVLGFLNLVAAFGLVSDFNGNELGKLLDIADPHKQAPELYHSLGIEDQLYAKLVLDLIQGSYSENKKEGTDIEEGIIRNYILLLEQLQEILPKINPQVKARAMMLAVEWKSRMRAVAENSLEIFGFLQLLATYELVASFQREEIFKLLFPFAHLKQAPKICTALGFADMAPGKFSDFTMDCCVCTMSCNHNQF
ncbi:hypothetical protein LWI28_003260 [Acer negundo]|uniref:FRIGIDA-like protein n=1 Tax=Acer negundo TaxID=4023 RepID=A0AAD5J2L5_ACENE|nr:hypothetical protein LWI28_003260 [Acer negundo]